MNNVYSHKFHFAAIKLPTIPIFLQYTHVNNIMLQCNYMIQHILKPGGITVGKLSLWPHPLSKSQFIPDVFHVENVQISNVGIVWNGNGWSRNERNVIGQSRIERNGIGQSGTGRSGIGRSGIQYTTVEVAVAVTSNKYHLVTKKETSFFLFYFLVYT